MRTVVRPLVPIIMVAVASMATAMIATPAVSSAECADGEWWGPDGQSVPAAGRWATTLGMRAGPVVGPDG